MLKETDITKQIRDVLNACRIFHWKNWSGPMTYPKGISDILGIYKGRFMAIEVKRPGRGPSNEQQAFLHGVNEADGQCPHCGGSIKPIGFHTDNVDKVVQELNLEVELAPLFNQRKE